MNEEKIKSIVQNAIKNIKQLAITLNRTSDIMNKLLESKSSNDLKLLNEKIQIINNFKEFAMNITPQVFTTNTMHIVSKNVLDALKVIPTLIKIAQNNKFEQLAKVMEPLPKLSTTAMKDIKDIAQISKNHLNIFEKMINKDTSKAISDSIQYYDTEYNDLLNEGETGWLTSVKDTIGDLWGSIPFINSDEQRIANAAMAANRDTARAIFSNNIDALKHGDASGMFSDLMKNGYAGSGFGSGFGSGEGWGTGVTWAAKSFKSFKDSVVNTFTNALGIVGGSIHRFEKGVSDFGNSFGGLWDQFTRIFNNGEGASLQSLGNFFTSPQFASAVGGLATMYALWKGISLVFNKLASWFKFHRDVHSKKEDLKIRYEKEKRRKAVSNKVDRETDYAYNDRDW